MARVEFLGKTLISSPYGVWSTTDIRFIVWVHGGQVWIERTDLSTNTKTLYPAQATVWQTPWEVYPEPPSTNYKNVPKYPGTESISNLTRMDSMTLAPIGTFDKILTKIYGYVAHEDNLLMM